MRSRDKIFYYGMIHYGNAELYLTGEVDIGIFDERHFFCYFQAMKGPLGSPMVDCKYERSKACFSTKGVFLCDHLGFFFTKMSSYITDYV